MSRLCQVCGRPLYGHWLYGRCAECESKALPGELRRTIEGWKNELAALAAQQQRTQHGS
jgi:hypothetical protein